ncbi:hypothetical protein EC80569_2393 [Escherichia coli 8.0569]|nr:hypothetical protein EC80569_2393 [Escherichia coli 8.0569]
MSWLSTICIRSPDPAVAASRIAGSESFRPSQLLIAIFALRMTR